MNRPLRLVVALLLLGGLVRAADVDESQEPPVGYTLVIGSQRVDLVPGQQAELTGTFKNPKVTLELGDIRHFPYGGIAFDYPARYGWDSNLENPALRYWTISGGTVTLLYFVSDEQLTPAAYCQQMAIQFGSENCEIADISETFDKKECKGQSIRIAQMGPVIVQRAYSLPGSDKKWRLFVVQDVLDDDGQPAAGLKPVMDMLRETLSIQ